MAYSAALKQLYNTLFDTNQNEFSAETIAQQELMAICQAEEHESNSAFNDVMVNNLRSLQRRLAADPSLICKRDACGGTLFHAAYLYERYKIGHWLVENFPREALNPFSLQVNLPTCTMGDSEHSSQDGTTYTIVETYLDHYRLSLHKSDHKEGESLIAYLIESAQGDPSDNLKYSTEKVKVPHKWMPFTGENILHMTIIRRNLEETRWLLDFYRNHEFSVLGGLKALLNANATGTLFQRRGNLYFGGYPLHFAVCCNDVTIFDLVLSFASSHDDNARSNKAKIKSRNEHHQAHKTPTSPSYENEFSVRRMGFFQSSTKVIPMNSDPNEDLREKGELQLAGDGKSYPYFFANADQEIYKCDDHGNNVLHFCVVHDLKAMYSHVKKTVERMIRRELKVALIAFNKAANLDPTLKRQIVLEEVFDKSELLTCYPPRQTIIDVPPEIDISDRWLEKELQKKLDERLMNVLNCDLHSPLTLAADYTKLPNFNDTIEAVKVDMLTLLLTEDLRMRYTFGPLVSAAIDINGLDRPYDRRVYTKRPIPPKAQMYGVVEWLCKSDSEQGLQIPIIRDLIGKKWKLIGIPIFSERSYVHVVFTFFMTVIAFYPYLTPFYADYQSRLHMLIIVAYVANAVIIASYLIHDFPYFMRVGLDWWGLLGGIRGAAIFDRFMRTIMIASYALLVYCKLGLAYKFEFEEPTIDVLRSEELHRISMVFTSTSVGAAWFYFFFFFLGFDSVAPFLLIIYRIVANDFAYFFRFYSVIVVTFGVATAVISNEGINTPYYGLYRSSLAMWTLLQDTVNFSGGDTSVIFLDSSFPGLIWLMDLYITVFYVLVVLLMLNLLIGMIGNTYSNYFQSKLGLVLMEQYNILSAIDLTTSRVFKRKRLLKYASSATLDKDRELIRKNRNDANLPIEKFEFEYQVMNPEWISMPRQRDVDAKPTMIALLIIDPQNDFLADGAMPIPGADEDCNRIAELIAKNMDCISDIFVTMQSHHEYHISHPSFWVDGNGNHPLPGQIIHSDDIVAGAWVPVVNTTENRHWCEKYLTELELTEKLPLTIWPAHCILQSYGHCVVNPISRAIQNWEGYCSKTATYYMKGQNTKTDAFSSIEAEVEDPNDVCTSLNDKLLNTLKIYDKVLICGQSLSHNVNFTVRDLARNWSKDMSKMVILEDGCSAYPGYEEQSKEFIEDMKAEGMQIVSVGFASTQILVNTDPALKIADPKKKRRFSKYTTMVRASEKVPQGRPERTMSESGIGLQKSFNSHSRALSPILQTFEDGGSPTGFKGKFSGSFNTNPSSPPTVSSSSVDRDPLNLFNNDATKTVIITKSDVSFPANNGNEDITPATFPTNVNDTQGDVMSGLIPISQESDDIDLNMDNLDIVDRGENEQNSQFGQVEEAIVENTSETTAITMSSGPPVNPLQDSPAAGGNQSTFLAATPAPISTDPDGGSALEPISKRISDQKVPQSPGGSMPIPRTLAPLKLKPIDK